MSNEEKFETTANEAGVPTEVREIDTSPEGIKKLAEKGAPQVLRLINENRKSAVEGLRRKAEALEATLEQIASLRKEIEEPLFIAKDPRDRLVFSLENTLIDIQKALDSVQTYAEAHNSLTDMVLNDMVGMVYNLKATQQALIEHRDTLSVVMNALLDKELLTVEDLRASLRKLQGEVEAPGEAGSEPTQEQEEAPPEEAAPPTTESEQ